MPPSEASLHGARSESPTEPEKLVVLTVDADGVPRAIGDLTESLPPKSAGLLRAIPYMYVNADVLGDLQRRNDLLERHYDVVREAAERLRPMLNNALGLHQTVTLAEVYEAFAHLAKMRPEDLEGGPSGG